MYAEAMDNALEYKNYQHLIDGANSQLRTVFPRDEDHKLVEINFNLLIKDLKESVDTFRNQVKTWNRNLDSKGNIFLHNVSPQVTEV